MCETHHQKFLLIFVVPVMIVVLDSVVEAVAAMIELIVIVEMKVVAVGLLNDVIIHYNNKYSKGCSKKSPISR